MEIKDLQVGDTIHIQKRFAGFTQSYKCSFLRYKKGMVHAEISESAYHPRRSTYILNMQAGEKITSRSCKCYLKDNNESCKWFRSKVSK